MRKGIDLHKADTDESVSEMINEIASTEIEPENMGFFARLLAFIKKLIKSFIDLLL